MGWGWLASAGFSALGGLFGQSNNNAQLTSAYNLAQQETPAEKEYRLKLEQESKFGDPKLNQKRNELYRPIFSASKSAKAESTGQAIRQGLENSIIASEMKSKIDAKTYQALDEQADKILSYNEEFKKASEDKLMQYKLQRDARLRDLAVGYQTNLQQSQGFMDYFLPALTNIGGQWATNQTGWNVDDSLIPGDN